MIDQYCLGVWRKLHVLDVKNLKTAVAAVRISRELGEVKLAQLDEVCFWFAAVRASRREVRSLGGVA